MFKNQFISAFNEVFESKDAGISGSTVYQELEFWDSMSALMLVAMCDSQFNLKLTGSDIRNSKTIDELVDLLEKK